ncbi:MAG: hypothetical protein HY075_09890 [Deltaproteobacteria bacterium]|nr:hypothetical protein [Deltaproteobacteria bacterium]
MTSRRAFACLLTLLAWSAPEARGEERVECAGGMLGHETGASLLKVCLGDGARHRSQEAALAAARTTDWFPYTRYTTLVGEVRVTCPDDDKPGANRVLFPARNEVGGRVRVELACADGDAPVRRSLEAVSKALLLLLKDRDAFARQVSRGLRGCRSKKPSSDCLSYQKLVKSLVSGTVGASVNGRPFRFELAGFEFRAGLAPETQRFTDAIDDADPVARIRALVRLKGAMEGREWDERTRVAFNAIPAAEQLKLVREALDDSDINVREWAMSEANIFQEPGREAQLVAIMTKAIDDPDSRIRFLALPFVSRLGDAVVDKVLADPDVGLRTAAYSILLSEPNLPDEQVGRLVTKALEDSEQGIRELGEGVMNSKLNTAIPGEPEIASEADAELRDARRREKYRLPASQR